MAEQIAMEDYDDLETGCLAGHILDQCVEPEETVPYFLDTLEPKTLEVLRKEILKRFPGN